jgi:hypothetical protein
LLGVPFLIAMLAFGQRIDTGLADALAPYPPVHYLSTSRELFLKTWFVVNFFVVYIPLSYQIHYLNGWQVPISILATISFYRRVIPWLKRQFNPGFQDRIALVQRILISDTRILISDTLIVVLLIIAVLPTNVYLLAWRFVDLGRYSHGYYLARDEWEALRWLDMNAPSNAIVFSSIDIGQYVPSVADKRAFLAHWTMTTDLYRKRDIVQAFFGSEMDDSERVHILQIYNVQYVFWGEAERNLGSFNPDKLPFTERVFSLPQAVVYRVKETSMNSDYNLGEVEGDGNGN